MSVITVVTGPPAAGKSTHVRESAATGDVVVDFDALAVTFGSKSSHDAPEPVRVVTLAARAAAIKAILAGIDADAWIIHTQPTDQQLSDYEKAGAVMVLVDPGIDAVLAQAKEDGRPDWTEPAIRQWYERNTKSADPKGSFLLPKGASMSTKLFATEIKASGPDDGLEEGQFEAYASVFGNIDSYNDIVVKGAFLESLAQWKASGSPIPLLFGHNMSDPDYNIGHIVDAKEDDRGLLVRAQLDLDAPKGASTYRLLKGRRVGQMSFAYKVLDSGPVEVDGVKATELRKLQIYEVSVVPVGANDQTEVLSVKAGRVLSAKNAENVKKAISALDVVREDLSALLDAATNDDSKASVRPVVKGEELEKVKDEEPVKAKSEEPAPVKSEELPTVASVDTKSFESFLLTESLERGISNV